MRIVEFQIPMPIAIGEYSLAQRYMTARATREDSAGSADSDGVRIIEQRQITNEDGTTGIYTKKAFYLENKIPGFVKVFLASDALVVYEECWNCFPVIKTVYSSPWLERKFKFRLELLSNHSTGFCPVNPPVIFQQTIITEDETAACSRPPEALLLDIVREVMPGEKAGKQTPSTDPSVVTLTKASYPTPLGDDWLSTFPEEPRMTCYKMIKVNIQAAGPVGRKLEQVAINFTRDMVLTYHKKLHCWEDDWSGVTAEQVLALEAEVQAEREAIYAAAEAAKNAKTAK